MAGFLYYVPLATSMNAAKAAEQGLAYAFDRGRCECCPVTRGPTEDLGPGVVFADPAAVRSIKLQLDLQTWVPFGGESSVWVGMWNEQPPTPDDLSRDPTLPGQWITDLTGGRWLAPAARRWADPGEEQLPLPTCILPARMARGEKPGQWIPNAVQPRYARLWALAVEFESARAACESTADENGTYVLRFDEINMLAILALQANYRVGEAEIDLLGIFDQAFRDAIVDVLIDRARLAELLKKKAAMLSVLETLNSTSGPAPSNADGPATTGQP